MTTSRMSTDGMDTTCTEWSSCSDHSDDQLTDHTGATQSLLEGKVTGGRNTQKSCQKSALKSTAPSARISHSRVLRSRGYFTRDLMSKYHLRWLCKDFTLNRTAPTSWLHPLECEVLLREGIASCVDLHYDVCLKLRWQWIGLRPWEWH